MDYTITVTDTEKKALEYCAVDVITILLILLLIVQEKQKMR